MGGGLETLRPLSGGSGYTGAVLQSPAIDLPPIYPARYTDPPRGGFLFDPGAHGCLAGVQAGLRLDTYVSQHFTEDLKRPGFAPSWGSARRSSTNSLSSCTATGSRSMSGRFVWSWPKPCCWTHGACLLQRPPPPAGIAIITISPAFSGGRRANRRERTGGAIRSGFWL